MRKTRFTRWIVLACIGFVAACTSGDGTTAGNTELNVIVPTNAGTPAAIDIQSVEYTINCQGNSNTFLDNAASFPDAVVLNGNLEVTDVDHVCVGGDNPGAVCSSNSDCQGTSPTADGTCELPVGSMPEVWQGFMDLPPGPCTVQLRARDGDLPVGEVICTATEPFNIVADTTTKVNLVLMCDTSFQAPVGMLDVDATFSFNVGNFCPDLFVLNCLDSAPAADLVIPVYPGILFATTTCEVRFRDGDSTCGQNCDPQTCIPAAEGLICTPGPDPAPTPGTPTPGAGVSTTVTCTNLTVDCDLNPLTPETSCTYSGDTLGILGVGQGNPATFAVACTPPALGGSPGVTGVCTAVTTDGDLDCNKTKTVEVTCPGLTPCDAAGCTDGVDCAFCDDLNDCTSDLCVEAGGVATCPNAPLPSGTTCSSAPAPAQCDGAGACQSAACSVLGCPDDGNSCTAPQTCNLVTELCEPDPPAGEPAGTACDAGAGASSGACDGTDACTPICVFNPACPDPGVECQVATCDPADGTCGSAAAPDGLTCDFSGPGSADGSCVAGACTFTPVGCNEAQTGDPATPQTQVVSVGCTNNVTTAQSPFPFILEVDVPVPVFGGSPFTAGLDGVGFFPEFFLDAAQGVVCGGLRTAQLVDFKSTVQVRSGATGADVPLSIDVSTLSPGAVRFCNFPTTQTCTVNGDCLGGVCNPAIILQDLPVLNGIPNSPGGCDADTSNCPIPGPPTDCDCSPCNALGGAKIAQCADNGFCQNGSLVLQMQGAVGNYTAAATGPVLFGWSDGQGAGTTPVPGLSICPVGTACGTPGRVNGCYQLPAASFANPVPPIGIRVNAGGLAVPIQCAQGEDGGTCSTTTTQGCLTDADCPGAETCIGVGVDDDVICPTPDDRLISCPVNGAGGGLVACDITEATCGAGESCNPTSQGDFCLPTGTLPEGAVCDVQNNRCQSGLYCVQIPADDPGTSYCRAQCDTTIPITCADGNACINLNSPSNLQACLLDSCDIFAQTGCIAGAACYPTTAYGDVCWQAGTGGAGTSCGNFTDCAAGTTCINDGAQTLCREICDNGSPSCSVGTCIDTGSGYGVCI